MPDHIGNNKRVIKNTIYLYFRMFITVIVSLYTSRVVLQYLGVIDYGILNVVGGFISMFGFITSTMTNASTRFFAFALGKGDIKDSEATFRTTVSIYFLLIVLIMLIAETVGLWFVWYKLNIPPERHSAAMIVYQISLLIFCVGLLRIPYNSSIIAHEHMNFYAYTSIIEVILKLAIVFLLTISPWDKLVFYNSMFFIVSIGVTFWYVYFCGRFQECRFGLNYDKEKFKQIFSFAGWNFTSNMGDVAIDQGINILINIFFGPAVNAARGIAYQIKGQVASFCTNFQTAASPQITKYFAVGDIDAMSRLVLQSSKVSFYLMFLMSLPAFVGMELILKLWLTVVPDYTLILARLALINIVINSLGGTMNIAIQASGKIKRYVLYLTTGKIFAFILTFIAFYYYKATPEYSIYCTILYALISITIQYLQYMKLIGIKIKDYLIDVVFRAAIVVLLSLCWVMLLDFYFNSSSKYIEMAIYIVLSFIGASFLSMFIGLNQKERIALLNLIQKKFKK